MIMPHSFEALRLPWALFQVLSTLTTTPQACPMKIFISQLSTQEMDLAEGW